jgi:hypothetical protein
MGESPSSLPPQIRNEHGAAYVSRRRRRPCPRTLGAGLPGHDRTQDGDRFDPGECQGELTFFGTQSAKEVVAARPASVPSTHPLFPDLAAETPALWETCQTMARIMPL